jgi:hypothetical protein
MRDQDSGGVKQYLDRVGALLHPAQDYRRVVIEQGGALARNDRDGR